MSSDKIRRIIVCLVLLIAFSVIAFAVPFERNKTFTLSYIFGVVSIAIQLLTFGFAFNSKNLKMKSYGMPIAVIGVVYMAFQIVFSLFGMAFAKKVKSWVVLVVSAVALCIALVLIVGADKQREYADKTDNS